MTSIEYIRREIESGNVKVGDPIPGHMPHRFLGMENDRMLAEDDTFRVVGVVEGRGIESEECFRDRKDAVECYKAYKDLYTKAYDEGRVKDFQVTLERYTATSEIVKEHIAHGVMGTGFETVDVQEECLELFDVEQYLA